MRILCLKSTNTKKVRGLKKKCRAMVQDLIACTNKFPVEFSSEKYWNKRLPVPQTFIDSTNTPHSVRRLCMQTMIDRAEFLAQSKPNHLTNSRVCCLIDLPALFFSEVTIFFSESYFQTFFDRNRSWQKWTIIQDKNLAKEYNLRVPTNFQVRGYQVSHYLDDNDPNILTYTGETWFIGEWE
jgi:hypothetical protein